MGRNPSPCASIGQFLRLYLHQGQSSMPTARCRTSGFHLGQIFFGGCIWKVHLSKVGGHIWIVTFVTSR